ncbi:hypothetical protein HOLleu_27097 [Holothuria leucospilota]|uniref:Ig-like domain-containing protein n=1 Tax=Holothuria leucospilota TaxID=206669 RepID=A0A9Q1H225_HOLLE|nr:hypothetical protein HOLleu_27097 [Holothuria leucospilota]
MERFNTLSIRIKFLVVRLKSHVLVIQLICLSGSINAFCRNNQTANLGEQGSITCRFPDDFHAVWWYDDASADSPAITYIRQLKQRRGPGFDDGSYNVLEDGSLRIPNVTIYHERTFSGIVYTDPNSHQNFHVSLVVVASPTDDLPKIPCPNYHQEFYHSAGQGEILSCSFNATRPPMQLAWFKKFGDEYEHLEMQQFTRTENTNGTFNSLATVHLLKGSSAFIHFLVCKATWPLSDWSRESEILLDFSSNISFSNVTRKVQYLEINRYGKIQCGQSPTVYQVWKRILPNSGPELIGFRLHGMSETISGIPDVEVSAEGSLIFASPRVQHEGIYVCISGDGQKEEIQMTSMDILIPPSPPYIQITGCNDDSYSCVFREDRTKKLTCAVYGARPDVTLEWIAENEDEISFFNHKLVFKEKGETSDSILSVEYRVSQDVVCGEEIFIKCHLHGPLSNIMKAESTVLVIPAFCRESKVKEEHGLDGVVIALAILCVLLVIVIAICLIYCGRRHQTKSTTSTSCNGDSQEAFLNSETKEAGREILNGIPPCIVNDTDEDML